MGKLRERMSFSRIDEVLEMPNLIEVQKNSYQRFLDTDLRETILWTSRKTPLPAAVNGILPMRRL